MQIACNVKIPCSAFKIQFVSSFTSLLLHWHFCNPKGCRAKNNCLCCLTTTVTTEQFNNRRDVHIFMTRQQGSQQKQQRNIPEKNKGPETSGGCCVWRAYRWLLSVHHCKLKACRRPHSVSVVGRLEWPGDWHIDVLGLICCQLGQLGT